MGSLRTSPLPTAGALVVLLLTALVPAANAHGLGHAPALPIDEADLVAPSVPPTDPFHPSLPGVPVANMGTDPTGLLPALPWESISRVHSESGTPWVPLMVEGKMVDADDGPVKGTMEFTCPTAPPRPSVEDGTNTMTLHEACPFRIIDDADLMGSPQIAVNPNDPNSLAFFSLHGAGTTEGPTPRSRDPNPEGTGTLTGLSHTTFTSPDEGVTWFDNPWGTDGFGEHVTGVMDNDGNLYIGALWSKRLGDGNFDYVIKAYKEQDGRFQISNYQPSKTFPNRAAGNIIQQANLVYVPEQSLFYVPEEPVNETGNATAPADDTQLGNATDPDGAGLHNGANDRVMMVWHEQARDWRNSTTGRSSWIDAAWTDTSSRDNWTRLSNEELIGPCMSASNPVSWNGKVYVACTADAGYKGRSRAHIGDVDVWSIDPMTGVTKLEDYSKISNGGELKMTARADGMMVVTATKVMSPDVVLLGMSFGWYGSHWEAREVGSSLHTLASNTATAGLPPGTPGPPPAGNDVVEARVTTMALSKDAPANTLFLVYMERIVVAGDARDPDPNNPLISPDSAIEYKKLVATFTACGEGPTNVYDLQLGVARHPFAQSIVGNATGVFDDLQDGMEWYMDPDTGQEKVYFAYGDHGVIQYGALVAGSSPSQFPCFVFPPPPFLPPAVIPAGLSATSPATTIIGSTVGLTATAMIGYLLTVKRKTVNALAAKAKK